MSDQQDIVIYQAQDGTISFNVNVFDETVWLTQANMANLFNRERSVISKHLNNVFKEGELDKKSNVQNLHIANSDKPVKIYNLDVVISVGYRVKSHQGIQFRQWATKVLKQYLLDGYAVNAQRMQALENKIDALSSELKEIYKVLTRLSERPININLHQQLGSARLEDKLIDLLDSVITSINSDQVKNQLQEIKQDIANVSIDSKAKNRLVNFFKEIGDSNSTVYKAIKGAGIAKNLIAELIKLGNKLKELL